MLAEKAIPVCPKAWPYFDNVSKLPESHGSKIKICTYQVSQWLPIWTFLVLRENKNDHLQCKTYVQSGLPPTPRTITKTCAIVFDTLGLTEADLRNIVVGIPP